VPANTSPNAADEATEPLGDETTEPADDRNVDPTDNETTEPADDETADRIVISYPSELSTWGQDIVEGDQFRAYLPKAHERAAPGDRWEEFVGVGCCGSALEVTLRVESIDGGPRLTSETTIEFTVRDACLAGGWEVQSEAGPE